MTEAAINLLTHLSYRRSQGDKFDENEALLYESLARALKAVSDLQRVYAEAQLLSAERALEDAKDKETL